VGLPPQKPSLSGRYFEAPFMLTATWSEGNG